MRIDPEWWPRLSELLDQWLDLPPDSRNQWLDRLGPEHADVLAVLRELVLHQPAAEAADFLGALPVFRNDADVVTTCELPVQFAVGMLMGPYRLVRELGVGGMGVVWLAERADGTLKRQVALKLPLLSAHNSRFAERLLREREILARLNHPHIAHLYDAGISLGGHPYFAMEYVEGEPLIGYCDRRRLNLERRLIIFVAVLRAVQYAHSNLVVHRDLKPSNILVTGSGEVRLLDFGVAKLLTEGVADATELTRIGGRALTPEYASPEQITNQAITTASDIYSLGVILYQLLCGERPYRLKRNTAGSLEEAILTADVIRPSRRITRAAQAEACGCTPRKLETTLRGDLDSIVLKALEKEPARRYSTADAFAQDIERYRSGEPVLAQPESRLYRMRKFVLRNKLAIASAAVVAAGLSIGLGVALCQTYAAILQKHRADTEAATARAVNDFLEKDLLAAASARVQAGPRERPDPDLKVRTVLDRAAARIAGKFHKQPLVEASIRQTIHAAYMDLGLYAEAQQQAELVLQLRRSALGDEHRDTLAAMNNLATVYQVEGKIGQAESLLSRVFTLQKRVLGSTHPDTLESMSTLALLYSDQGRYADAELLLKQGLKLAHGALNERNPVVLTMMNNLALMYRRLDKHAQAEELYTAVLNLRRRDLGEEHPDTLITMNNLAVLYSAEHKYTQAEPLFAKVLEVRNQVLGKDHPSTLVSMNTLAVLYREEKRYADAERLLADVLERKHYAVKTGFSTFR